MSQARGWIAVLWGENFDEKAATIFVTELRAAGLWVKIVGLNPLPISGSHGMVIVPDFTLDEALAAAQEVIGVIIPYASPGIKRLRNDPRLRMFCERAVKNEAGFVIGLLDEGDIGDLALFPNGTSNLVSYPIRENLVKFGRDLAKMFGALV